MPIWTFQELQGEGGLETTGTDPRPLGALELQGVGDSSFPPDKAGGARSSPSLQGGSWDRCLWTLCT